MTEEGGTEGVATTGGTPGGEGGTSGYDYRKLHNYPLVKVGRKLNKNDTILFFLIILVFRYE